MYACVKNYVSHIPQPPKPVTIPLSSKKKTKKNKKTTNKKKNKKNKKKTKKTTKKPKKQQKNQKNKKTKNKNYACAFFYVTTWIGKIETLHIYIHSNPIHF